MIGKLLGDERGVALVIAVAFMMLSLPMAIAALRLASTLALDSRSKTDILKSQYATMAGEQYARYLLIYDSPYTTALPLNQVATTTININGKSVAVTILKTAQAPPAPAPSPESGRELLMQKTVTPGTVYRQHIWDS